MRRVFACTTATATDVWCPGPHTNTMHHLPLSLLTLACQILDVHSVLYSGSWLASYFGIRGILLITSDSAEHTLELNNSRARLICSGIRRNPEFRPEFQREGINKLLNKLSQILLCTIWTDKSLFDCRVWAQQQQGRGGATGKTTMWSFPEGRTRDLCHNMVPYYHSSEICHTIQCCLWCLVRHHRRCHTPPATSPVSRCWNRTSRKDQEHRIQGAHVYTTSCY
jgi:hypothetical protein